MWKMATGHHSSTTAISLYYSGLGVVGGMTFYLVHLTGNNFAVYNSIEAAINGVGSGQFYYNNATTTPASLAFDCQLVRYSNLDLSTSQ